ncbi:MAG: heparin lyase I family protein, partial [Nitrosospira sp.]
MTILFDGRFSQTSDFSLYDRIERAPEAHDVPPITGGVPGVYEIVTDPIGTESVAKITARAGSPGRCELRPFFRDTSAAAPEFGERWYAWWDLFPNDFFDEIPGVAHPETNLLSSTEDIVAQCHSHPDFGDGSHAPQFSLYVQGRRIKFMRTHDTVTPTTEIVPNLTVYGSWPLEKMRWIEWVLHVNWAINSNGFFHLYKDRRRVHSQVGAPNTYNDALGPYFKSGFYKYSGTLSPATRVRYA